MKHSTDFARRAALWSLPLLVAAVANAQERGAADRLALTEARCTSAELAAVVPATAIGERVASVALDSLVWVPPAQDVPGHCLVNGRLLPVDTSSTAQPIRFAVALPE